jgi:phospholipase/carboxylesterase
MRAWYDIYSLDNLDREDREGLLESQHTVESLIYREMERGIAPGRIILMGFSQGGAVVLFTGLRFPQRLAGIGALSTYLPLADTLKEEQHPANAEIPIFMAHGEYDPVVRFALGERSHQFLRQQGYTPDWHHYPMEHSVCMEEIHAIAQWFSQLLSS